MFENFAEGGAFSSSDDGNVFGGRVGEHGGMYEGFVVFAFGIGNGLMFLI